MWILELTESIVSIAVGIVAIITLTLVKRQLFVSQQNALIGLTHQHNVQIIDDEYARCALDTFQQSHIDLPMLKKKAEELENRDGGLYRLYWATRGMHLSHMNLILFAWKLSGQNPQKFEKNERGWAHLAHSVYRHVYNYENCLDNMPEWYKSACQLIDTSDKDSATTNRIWQEYTRSLVQKPNSEIGN